MACRETYGRWASSVVSEYEYSHMSMYAVHDECGIFLFKLINMIRLFRISIITIALTSIAISVIVFYPVLKDYLNQKNDWIEGIVMNEKGEPVVGANIMVSDGRKPSQYTKTDSLGYYHVGGLDRDICQVSLTHDDYGFYTSGPTPTNEMYDFTVSPPIYSLSGAVLDYDYNPVEGANVRLGWTSSGFVHRNLPTSIEDINRLPKNAPPRLVYHNKPVYATDTQGRFTITDIPKDNDVALEVMHPDFGKNIFKHLSVNGNDRTLVIEKQIPTTVLNQDTGKFRYMVEIDPTNKKNIKGFIYIAHAWGTELEPSSKRALFNLSKAINEHTKIEAHVDAHLYLDDKDIFKLPFVYISEDNAFELTKTERASLNEYLRSGGFVVADNGQAHLEHGEAESSLRDMFRDVLGQDAQFMQIANSHQLYHCFYDFNNGPPLGSDDPKNPVDYLEGIWLDNRLVAIYCDKGYGPIWEKESGNEEQLKMGINMVVYALIQECSIAQKQFDQYRIR